MHSLRSRAKAPSTPTRTPSARPGFTLVELLVVIGIIGLLIGLLLPALGKVIERAKSTQTLGTMQEFAKACDAYFQEFGEYPEAIPSSVLYQGVTNNSTDPITVQQLPRITQMENALLALMGGYRVPTDPDYATFGQTSTPPAVELTFNTTPIFRIKVDATKMGEGPYKNGRKYEAFYAPKGREFGKAAGQMSSTDALPEAAGGGLLPELVDAWGAPIAYISQMRSLGPIVRNGSAAGQFERKQMIAYSNSTALGDAGVDQTEPAKGSVLCTNAAGGTSAGDARRLTFGQLLRHPALNATTAAGTTVSDADRVFSGTPRGKYFLFSAGPDGIYFSRSQVRTPTGAVMTDIVSQTTNPEGPRIIERFDDIVVAGGS
jgi:prepilin-type N-terminal cleavage/methylation domain-containing protein